MSSLRYPAVWAFLAVFPITPCDILYAGPVFDPVGDDQVVEYSQSNQLTQPAIIRHRFAILNSDDLWQALEATRDLENFTEVDLFQFNTFDDSAIFLQLGAVHVRYWSILATFSVVDANQDSSAEILGVANLHLTREGALTLSINSASRGYFGVLPADELPYHVIFESDPAHMPALD